MYALINTSTNTVTEFPILNLRARFPNRSFPVNPTPAQLPPELVEVAVAAKPAVNLGEKAVLASPTFSGVTASWSVAWDIVPMTVDELAVARQEVFLQVREEASARLDAFAQTRNYDSIVTLCSYAGSADASFAAEGQRGQVLRDQTWRALIDYEAGIDAGTIAQPTSIDEILAVLPALTWA